MGAFGWGLRADLRSAPGQALAAEDDADADPAALKQRYSDGLLAADFLVVVVVKPLEDYGERLYVPITDWAQKTGKQLSCQTSSQGGTYAWSKYSGPEGGTVDWQDTSEQANPTFSADKAGHYVAKVVYRKQQEEAEDLSGDIYVIEADVDVAGVTDDGPDTYGTEPVEYSQGAFLGLSGPRVAITLSASPLAEGDQGTVTLTHGGQVEVYDAATGGNKLTGGGLVWDLPDEEVPATLYLQPVAAGTGMLTLSYTADSKEPDWDPTYDATHSDQVKVTVVSVDLGIAPGGHDLDNGEENTAQPTQVLGEGVEENPGAYLLVNWDNDDGDDPPVPDLDESYVANEDNLAKLALSLSGPQGMGTLELVVDEASPPVKFWQNSSKGTEVEDLSWDLATESPPAVLWLEGRTKSVAERDLAVTLRYKAPGGAVIAQDTVKATVVMINLGNAVYRESTLWPFDDYGHTAIVWRFIGPCTRDMLLDDDSFSIIEMDGPTNNLLLSTMTEAPGHECFGCFTNTQMTYAERLRVLATACELVDRAAEIGYTIFNVVRPAEWDDSLDGLTHLRCDGLVEVCYEFNGINVWGDAHDDPPPHYDVLDDDYQAEHDDYRVDLQGLFPVTQCAHEPRYYWDTQFQAQDLCKPVGSTGGN